MFARIRARTIGRVTGIVLASASTASAQPVLYVDWEAPGANDGSSWADAFTDLQDALAGVGTNGAITEVRVAAGVYQPTTGTDRSASFVLQNGLAITGGYAGYGEPDPNARDFELYETTLSGDLNGDDAGTNGRGENTYHVVVGSDTDVTAVLDGFTITGGNADAVSDAWGGGMFSEHGSPTIVDCTFTANSAKWDGGGSCGFRGQPTLTRCTFVDNWAGHDGGGLCNHDGELLLTDCVFRGNLAGSDGGGVFTDAYWNLNAATLTRCTFIENEADSDSGFGGGVWSGDDATLVNCVFACNAAHVGGGMYNAWSDATLVNCTFTENLAHDATGGFLTEGFSSVASLTNCILWANADGFNPQEAAQVAAPSGTLDVGYSCVQGLSGDLGGTGNIADDPLFVDPAGDDYHLQPGSPCVNAGGDDMVSLPGDDFEGDVRVQQCRVDIGADETGSFRDCNFNALPDACDIVAGTSLDCDSNGRPDECGADCNVNDVPDDCDIEVGTSADCNVNGTPDECDVSFGPSPDDNGNGVPDECEAEVLFVKKDATGLNHGTNWTDAYNDLQRALAVAAAAGNAATEIWVAAGTYHPTADGDCTAGFRLVNGIALYGGFAGGEIERGQREPDANATILSGDLADDDTGTNGLNGNSLHVVVADGVDATAVLDGFVITAGNADVDGHDTGGGMLVVDASPTLGNCRFIANSAVFGGGLYVGNGGPALVNCWFLDNWAYYKGGAMYNDCASPAVLNTAFAGNLAAADGGAVYNANVSGPVFVNCAFTGNAAATGGAVYMGYGSVVSAVNCTFTANEADDAGGVYGGFGSTVRVANCVLWGNRNAYGFAEPAQIDASLPDIHHSCVEGWTGQLGGSGNIGDDPLLTDPDGIDDLIGTLDDDARLSAGSPGIDAGSNGAYADVGTAGVPFLPDTDLAGRPRFFDDPTTDDTGGGAPPIVDIGAHEYPGDCNDNGVPDDLDLAGGASPDVNSNGVPDECEPDCDGNGTPDDLEPDCNDNGVPDACDLAAEPETMVYYVYEDDLVDCPYDCGSGPFGCYSHSGGTQPGFAWTDSAGGPVWDVKIEFNVGRVTPWSGSRTTALNGMPTDSVSMQEYDYCAPTDGELFAIDVDPRKYVVGDRNVFGITGPSGGCDGFTPRAEFGGAFARITVRTARDCNGNSIPDFCDIDAGTSNDVNDNLVPDACEPDCNHNAVPDDYEIAVGSTADCNTNGVPDGCEDPSAHDCCHTDHDAGCSDPFIEACVCALDPYCCETDWDRVCVDWVVSQGCGHCDFVEDCNTNSVPDECDIAAGTSADVAPANGVPDECEVPAAGLMASAPQDRQSLWRTANNFMRLTFDSDITAPDDNELWIEVMDDGGLYGSTWYTTGPGGAADFVVTVNTNGAGEPCVLEIRENGPVLSHRTWIAVRNTGAWAGVGDFVVRYLVQAGDVNNDGMVLANDVTAVFPKIPIFSAADDERADVNGDGKVLSNDVGPVFPNIPSFDDFRPTGHGL